MLQDPEKSPTEKPFVTLSNYTFDKVLPGHLDGTYRNRDAAEAELDVLLSRLGVESVDRKLLDEHPDAKGLLIRYCTDLPLNIAWYEVAIRSGTRYQRRMAAGIISLASVVMVFLAVPSIYRSIVAVVQHLLSRVLASVAAPCVQAGPVLTHADQTTSVEQIVLFSIAALGFFKMVAVTTDHKARITGFSSASADLKEALFTFEETWRGKVFVTTTGVPRSVSSDFIAAVVQELRFARRIAREERANYINTVKSPSDVITAATDVIAAVAGKRNALLDMRENERLTREARVEAAAKRISAARDELAEAEATVLAMEAKQRELEQIGADAKLREDVRLALVDARAARVKAQALLNMTARADALNPV